MNTKNKQDPKEITSIVETELSEKDNRLLDALPLPYWIRDKLHFDEKGSATIERDGKKYDSHYYEFQRISGMGEEGVRMISKSDRTGQTVWFVEATTGDGGKNIEVRETLDPGLCSRRNDLDQHVHNRVGAIEHKLRAAFPEHTDEEYRGLQEYPDLYVMSELQEMIRRGDTKSADLGGYNTQKIHVETVISPDKNTRVRVEAVTNVTENQNYNSFSGRVITHTVEFEDGRMVPESKKVEVNPFTRRR